jgi:hypothetical protein
MKDYVCGILDPLGLTLICKAVYKLIEEAEKHFQTLQKPEPSPTKDESKKRRGRQKKTTTVPFPVRQTRNSAAQAKLTSDLKMLDSSIVNPIPTESSIQPKQTRIRTKQTAPDTTQIPTNSVEEQQPSKRMSNEASTNKENQDPKNLEEVYHTKLKFGKCPICGGVSIYFFVNHC